MNKPSPVNQTTLRIIYYRNKQFIAPVIIFAVCIVIIAEAIFPQIQEWVSIRSQVSSSIQKIDQLNKNIDIVSNTNDNALNNEILFLSQVLPQNKDYIGVLNAISQAAIISGTALGDYSFDVGDLSKTVVSGNTIQIRLSITGGVAEAKKFISALKKQAPISDIADIQISNNTVTIVSVFYFKPFPNVSLGDDNITTVDTLSSQENKLLQTLQESIILPPSPLSLTSL